MAKIEKGIAKKAKAHQRYRLEDGTIVPGATTVLGIINKPALVKWANNLGLQGIDSSNYVDETARVGTLAHEMIQEYLNGPKWDRDAYSKDQIDLAENAVLSFFEWEKQAGHTMKTQAIELQLVHQLLCYGGSVDWYGEIDGKMWLVDIKTSSALWPEHVYQVSAYRELLVHNGYQVDGVRLLRVGRTEDEGFDDHVITGPQLDIAFCVFLSALGLYQAQQKYNKAFVHKKKAKASASAEVSENAGASDDNGGKANE